MRPAPSIPISRKFFNTARHLASGLSKTGPPKHQLETSLLILTSTENRSPSYFSMPKKCDTVKAANLRRTKSKAKVIEWESREYSRGIRDVPVEVVDLKSRPKPRKKASRRPRAEKNAALRGETAPQPMDVDETFWVEEPVMPTSKKKVRLPPRPT
jgi:hypothetical protein